MDSLLATYASSDEEEDHHQQHPQLPPPPPTSTTSSSSKPALSLFASLPKPQSSSSSSSSVFSSLPPPKSSSKTPSSSIAEEAEEEDSIANPPSKAKPLFSLPPPKSQTISTPDLPLPPPNPKRVVQFRPPVPQPSSRFDNDDDDDDDDDDDEDEEERERKKQRQLGQEDTSVKSFLSSMPTPKNSGSATLGGGPPSLGSGRRSIVDMEGPTPSSSDANGVDNQVGFESNVGSLQETSVDGSYAGDYSYVGHESYGAYGSSGDYGNDGSYGHHDGTWYDTSSGSMAPETSAAVQSYVGMGGKRRKDQPPPEIIEVKQDELIKNRPREDQVKLTGLAFGPSYQPASTKGKPSKLHKRKHQIGALYFDMRQKEMELAERRAKGLLTKAQTQGKYGW